jgi:hypothetical protein
MTSLLSDITPISNSNPPDLDDPWLPTFATKAVTAATTSHDDTQSDKDS